MLREIVEGQNKTYIFNKGKSTYDEILDFLDANGGYESISEYVKGNFGVRGNWNSTNGDVWEMTNSEFKKISKALKEIGELEELDGVVNFGKILSKRDFDNLSSKGQLALVYNWLSGKTDIQPSNIGDLVVSANNKKATFTSNSSTVDVGKDSMSGMEDLPFGMKFSDLKKLVKEVKNA